MKKVLKMARRVILRCAFHIAENAERKDTINFSFGMVALWTFLAIKWKFNADYYVCTTLLMLLLPGNWRTVFLKSASMLLTDKKKKEYMLQRAIDVAIYGRFFEVSTKK